ncbi:unnamed protein product, partial [Brenthis ino]
MGKLKSWQLLSFLSSGCQLYKKVARRSRDNLLVSKKNLKVLKTNQVDVTSDTKYLVVFIARTSHVATSPLQATARSPRVATRAVTHSLSDNTHNVKKIAKMAGMKFCGSSSRLLLLSVPAFIMLSAAVAVVTEKSRSCYWCGPLAEQVHRSRRAPPCDVAGNHVTTCEPDLPHCAIVATSPPYVESRFCVKIYQDECYPLFCNSTKTWKMTCPCRGDLCNGPNTEREEEAFAILYKLVTKTQTSRIKKRTQLSPGKLVSSNDQNTIIITNISAIENNELNVSLHNVTDDDITKIMLGDQPTKDGESDQSLSSTEIASTADDIQEETTKKTETVEMRDIIPAADTKDDIRKGLEILKTDKLMNHPVKPSEELPTAEALQQNTSPKAVTEKTTTEAATSETIMDTTTESNTDKTTHKSETKNGASKLFETSIIFINIISFYIHFILSHII